MGFSNLLKCFMVATLLSGCTGVDNLGRKESESSAVSSLIVDYASSSSISDISGGQAISKLYELTEPVQTANGLTLVDGEKFETRLKFGLRGQLSYCSNKETIKEIEICYSSIVHLPSSSSQSSSSLGTAVALPEEASPYERNYVADLLGADNYHLHDDYWSVGRGDSSGNLSVEVYGVESQSIQALDLGSEGQLALYSLEGVVDGTASIALSFRNEKVNSNAVFERRFKPNDQIKLKSFSFDHELGGSSDWSMEMDGTLLKAYKSGDILYIVSQYRAQLNGVKYDFNDIDLLLENETIIAEAEVENFFPSYIVNGIPVILNESCYEQHGLLDSDSLSSPLIFITSVNLRSKELVSTSCINAPIDYLLVNDSGVLLIDQWRDDLGMKTTSHYFSMSNGMSKYEMTNKLLGNIQPKSMLNDEVEVVLINGFEITRLNISGGSSIVGELAQQNLLGDVSRFYVENDFVVAATDHNEIFTLSRQGDSYAILASNEDLRGAPGNIWRVSESLYLMIAPVDSGGVKLATFFVESNEIKKLDEYVYEGSGFFSEALLNRFSVNIDAKLGYVSMPFVQDWRDQDGSRGLIFYKFNDDAAGLPRLAPLGVQFVDGDGLRADFSEEGVIFLNSDRLEGVDWAEFGSQESKQVELGLRCNNSGVGYARYRHTYSSHFCGATNTRENIDTGEIKTFYGGSLSGGLGGAHYCDYSVPIDEPGNYIIHWDVDSGYFGAFDREYLISEYGCPSPIE